jgi:predicted MFS family arabinose efflux permease
MQQPEVAMRKQRWVLILAAAASFMVSLDSLVVTTALPTIRHGLGASLSSLEWTVNAYTLSFAVLLMSAAALGDRYGRRRMFTFGVTLFGAASVGCALAPSAGFLVAARAVQGAGAAFVMPLALALLTGAFAPRDRPRALGIFAAAAGSAVALGVVLAVAGATIAPTYASIYAMVDHAAPAGTVTEAFAWLNTAVAIGASIGAACAGSVADAAGPAATFALAGAAGTVAALTAALRARPLDAPAHVRTAAAPA